MNSPPFKVIYYIHFCVKFNFEIKKYLVKEIQDFFKNFEGGKKCPWPNCQNRVFHDKWAVAPEVLEKRYGKRMEDNREMYDMEDFLYGD